MTKSDLVPNRPRIRRGDAKDAAALSKLARETFWDAFHTHPANRPEDMAAYMAQAFSEDQIYHELRDQNNIFFLAEIGDETAGYAKLISGAAESSITAERPAELSRLYIHQRFLGGGVGPALMDRCLESARALGCDALWLGVWEFNPRARRFYERYGFRPVGTHIFQLGSDPQTDILMQLDLE